MSCVNSGIGIRGLGDGTGMHVVRKLVIPLYTSDRLGIDALRLQYCFSPKDHVDSAHTLGCQSCLVPKTTVKAKN